MAGSFDDVVTLGCRDHLLMVDLSQAWNLSKRDSVAAELIGMDDFRNIVLSQQLGQEGLCSFSLPASLKENIEHGYALVHSPPKPVTDTIDARADLVYVPSGFPVAQLFGEERGEFDTSFEEVLMTDLLGRAGGAIPAHLGHSVKSSGTAALGVLDDRHGKAVAVGVGIGHGGSAYLELVKATQAHGPL